MPSRTNESSIDNIIWEEPPIPEKERIKGVRDPYSTIFINLRERPGDWCRLSTYHKQGAAITQIERWSNHKQLKDYEWAAVKVRNRFVLYVRYTGKRVLSDDTPKGVFMKAVKKAVAS